MQPADTNQTTTTPELPSGLSPKGQAAALVVLTLGLAWAYWPTLTKMAERWWHDPQYSHGFLVPVFALVVLWRWRDRCPVGAVVPCWGGLLLLLVSAVLRLTAAYLYYEPLEALSLVPAVAGLVWAAFGWPASLPLLGK